MVLFLVSIVGIIMNILYIQHIELLVRLDVVLLIFIMNRFLMIFFFEEYEIDYTRRIIYWCKFSM